MHALKWIPLLFLCNQVNSYVITGVGNFAFGTVASPFPTLLLPNPSVLNVCVSAGLLESTNYQVTMTSSNGGSTSFLLGAGSATLPYHVFWASPTTLTEVSAGTPTAFSNARIFLNTCPGTGPNVRLQIQILSTDQVLARQGSYTDTLTILITA